MAGASSPAFQTRNDSVVFPSFSKSFVNHQLNVLPLLRVGVDGASSHFSVIKKSIILKNRFYGTRLQASGGETLHLWHSDGPWWRYFDDGRS
ncbi:glutamate synthase [NADH] [Sarracenia purpurea var. burkii]